MPSEENAASTCKSSFKAYQKSSFGEAPDFSLQNSSLNFKEPITARETFSCMINFVHRAPGKWLRSLGLGLGILASRMCKTRHCKQPKELSEEPGPAWWKALQSQGRINKTCKSELRKITQIHCSVRPSCRAVSARTSFR